MINLLDAGLKIEKKRASRDPGRSLKNGAKIIPTKGYRTQHLLQSNEQQHHHTTLSFMLQSEFIFN
jgi:hypothetical protein